MAKNKKFKSIILPADFKDLKRYIVNHRSNLMENVVSSVEFALENNLPMVEVFRFSKSDYVITLSKTQFKENMENILSYFSAIEKYELCNRVKNVIDKL